LQGIEGMTKVSTALRRSLACGVAALGLLVAASGALAQGQQYTVTLSDMSYGPTPKGLKVGDTITWINNDGVQHSVTARDKSFDLRLGPGERKQLLLQKAGNIPFFCTYHPTMRGVLSVGN
jgi:plastocyanin